MLKKLKKQKRKQQLKIGLNQASVVKTGVIAAVAAGIITAGGSPQVVQAEGSRDLVENGGDRPYTLWDAGSTAGIANTTTLHVYVKAGETLNLGTSVTGGRNNEDIIIKDPKGVRTTFNVQTSSPTGYIDTVAKETNGPFPSLGGYTPYQVVATASTEGWWTVEFPRNANGISGPTPKSATEQFPTTDSFTYNNVTYSEQGGGAAAWDVTVTDSSDAVKEGRMYANYVSLYMGENNRFLRSKFYILTADGYTYETDMNGLDPNRFIFYSNNRGFVDADQSTLYHSILGNDDNLTNITGGAEALDPNAANTTTNITHKVFFNKPSEDLPADIVQKPIAPEVAQGFSFQKSAGAQTNRTATGQGGQFTFTTNKVASYRLLIDTTGPQNKPDGVYDPSEDVLIENISQAGTNTVIWDGKDNAGNVVPAGVYKAEVRIKGGEYHFPMLDVEQAPNGIKVALLETPDGDTPATNPDAYKVYYNDENYKTSDGTSVNLDPKIGEVAPIPRSATAGVDSLNGAHAFNKNYGNTKGIDTWTYFLGENIETDLIITDATVSGNVFSDSNKSGAKDAAESGIANIPVSITDRRSGVTQTVLTDASGNYQANVLSGDVDVVVDDSSLVGYSLTAGNKVQTIKAAAGQTTSFAAVGFAQNNAPQTADLDVETSQNVTVKGTIVATDQDNDTLSYELTTGSTSANTAHGTVTLNSSTGSWEYTPVDGYVGNDEFKVKVSDGQGGVTTSTVKIKIKNVNPTIADSSENTPQNQTLVGSTPGKDVQGDSLTYAIGQQGTKGTASVKPDGTWTFKPVDGAVGTDTFTILVTDQQGATATATITVDITNIAPNIQDDQEETVQNVPVGGTAVGTDVAGDALVYSLGQQGSKGKAVVNADGTWVYTPEDGAVGDDTFTIIVTDTSSATGTSEITITIKNVPPTIQDDAKVTQQNQPVSGVANHADVAGDAPSFKLGQQGTKGSAVVNADGTWTYTPNDGEVGVDTFTIVVTDQAGATATSKVTITIENVIPTVADDAVKTEQNQPVSGVAVGSDVVGDNLTYKLGQQGTKGTAVVKVDGTWTYTPTDGAVGKDTFTIVVTDMHSATGTSTITITVDNVAPTIEDDTQTTEQNKEVTGTAVGKDAAGETLTYEVEENPLKGTVEVDSATGMWKYKPTPGEVGVDSFKIAVMDASGEKAVMTVKLTITNVAPTIKSVEFVKTPQNTVITGIAEGTDVEGDTLTYEIGKTGDKGFIVVDSVTGSWTYTPTDGEVGEDMFTIVVKDESGAVAVSAVTVLIENTPPTIQNDAKTTVQNKAVNGVAVGKDVPGDTLTYSLDQQGKKGTAVVNVDGTWTYTPEDGEVGSDTFTIVVKDESGATATSTVTLTITNVLPTIGDDTQSTFQNEAVSGIAVGKDVMGDTLTYALGQQGKKGTATVNANGKWTYVPANGEVGADTFTIVVKDESGATATSTVTIYIVNIPPSIENGEKTTYQNTAVSGTNVGTDVDGDTLVYSIDQQGKLGTATVDENGKWTYTPQAGVIGEDAFIIMVKGKSGAMAKATIKITIVNQAPSVGDDKVETKQNQAISGKVTGTDPDVDTLTYSKALDPANGSVVVKADGTWTYTPKDGFVGVDQFKVLVSDGKGGTALSTIEITVINVPPTVQPTKTQSILQRKALSGRILAGDVNGDQLTYKMITAALHGEVTIDESGVWSYTPNDGYVGTDAFTVQVSDGKGGLVETTIEVDVLNQQPTLTSSKDELTKTTVTGKAVTGRIQAKDLDGDQLIYTLSTPPQHGKVTMELDGTYSYQPEDGYVGLDQFTVLVSDGKGGTSLVTISVNVEPQAEVLPKTGSVVDQSLLLGIASASLLAGAALRLVGRRKEEEGEQTRS